MCTATEYDELPVRHNEDLINIELSAELPLKAEALGLVMWDPHVKAYLLLQAHMSRIELPISDYITDSNSVLDQSIRILQASIDVLTELGYLSSTRMMMKVMQCIKQARWPDDGPLSMLPGVEVEVEKQRMAKPDAVPNTIVEVPEMDRWELERLVRFISVPAFQSRNFLRIASTLPSVDINITKATAASLEATLTRETQPLNWNYGIHAPKFPKSQTESYFVVLGDEEKDEIYALKRVSWSQNRKGGKATANISLSLPEGLEGKDASLFVVSDGYIGAEWRRGVSLQTDQVVPGVWIEKDEATRKGLL